MTGIYSTGHHTTEELQLSTHYSDCQHNRLLSNMSDIRRHGQTVDGQTQINRVYINRILVKLPQSTKHLGPPGHLKKNTLL